MPCAQPRRAPRAAEGINGTQGSLEDPSHLGGRRGAHVGPYHRPQPLVLRRARRARRGPELRTNRASRARAGSAGARPPAPLGGDRPACLWSLAVGFPVYLPLCPSGSPSPLALGPRLGRCNPCRVRALAGLESTGPRPKGPLTGARNWHLASGSAVSLPGAQLPLAHLALAMLLGLTPALRRTAGARPAGGSRPASPASR